MSEIGKISLIYGTLLEFLVCGLLLVIVLTGRRAALLFS